MIIGTGICRRKEQHVLLKHALKELIKSYCEEKQDCGWSVQAQNFYLELEGWPSPSFAEPHFLKLYQRAGEFAQSLYAHGTYFASYLVSSKNLEYYGYGSTLKVRIQKLLESYNPYHIQWIDSEIEYQKSKSNSYSLPQNYCIPFYYSYLSGESKQILAQALKDEAIMMALKKDISVYNVSQYFNELVQIANDVSTKGSGSFQRPNLI